MTLVVQGYVIRVIPYKDSDAITTIITKEYGLIVFKARGIYKINSKNASCCQLFAYGEFTLEYKTENGNKTLSKGQLISYPFLVFEDLVANSLLSFLCEVIIKCEETSKYEGFSLMQEVCSNLNKDKLTLTLIIMKYIMQWNGILIQVDHCIYCGNKHNIVGIDFHDGGFVCADCRHNNVTLYKVDYLKYTRCIMKANIKNIDDFKIDQCIGYELIKKFFIFIEEAVGLNFKAKELIVFSFKNA